MAAQNTQRVRQQTRHVGTHLLHGGFAICGYCGWTMHPGWAKGVPVYPCAANKYNLGTCTKSAFIRAHIIDRAVWQHVETLLEHPEIILAELTKRRETDPTEADLSAIDRSCAELNRKRANLAKRIALIDDDEAATPLVAEITALGKQKQ